MHKSKYRFNPESLSFVRVRIGFWGWVVKILKYFFAGCVIAVGYYVMFDYFFDSPRERMLRRENGQLKLQYEILQHKLEQVDEVLSDLQQRDDNIYRTVFEAEPIPKTVRNAGMGGVNRYEMLEGYQNADLIINTTRQLDHILKKMYIQTKSYDELVVLAKNKGEMLASIPAIMPVSNKDLTRTASGWGYRIHPIYKIRKFHYGMDFTAPTGTDIYVTGDGTVEKIENDKRGYGTHIVINHGFGYKSLYAHLSAYSVQRGQKVKRGDVIGNVGNTGTSTAPHLHYEVEKNGEKVNPINFYFNDLTADQFNQMIEISSSSGQTFD